MSSDEFKSSRVEQSYGLWDAAVSEPDGAVPSARRQQEFVAAVIGFFDDPICLLPAPLGLQVFTFHSDSSLICEHVSEITPSFLHSKIPTAEHKKSSSRSTYTTYC